MACQLTISIPTWNRCRYLQHNVLSIVNIVKTLPPGTVELFISDNHSDDGTHEFLQDMCTQYAFIRYHQQPHNVGANANFYTVLAAAKGEYVWLLGDDDAIIEASILQILHDLTKYSPSIVIGGTQNDTTNERVYLTEVKEYLLTNQMILNRFDGIALAGKMSVLIFKTKALQMVLEPGYELIVATKTPWPHLIWFFKLLARDHSLLILPYATNYFIEAHRYNLLQTGTARLNLSFVDYARVLQCVADEFSKTMQKALTKRLTAGRWAELIKILAYSTFLNTSQEIRKEVVLALRQMPTLANQWMIFIGYALPSLLPQWVRYGLFYTPLIFVGKNSAYRKFIAYLRHARALSRVVDARGVYNTADL